MAVVLVVLAATAGVVIAAQDERSEGEVVRVTTSENGGKETWREQDGGRIVIEHQDPDGSVWFESNEVVGSDGEPIICPDGTPLRIDLAQDVREPSDEEWAAVRARMGDDPSLAVSLNEFTGKLELVDAVVVEGKHGTISVPLVEPKFYRCGSDNEPVTVPWSEVDPEAAHEARRDAIAAIKEQADSGELDELTGLGGDPLGLTPGK